MGNFINKLSKYQIIPRELIFDNTMSDRARFIYCYMASKPDGWEFYLNPMAKEVGYSVETLRKYINELIKNGWLIKGEQKNEGTFGAVTYTLNSTKKTDTEKTRHGKNPTQHIIDSLDITDESFKKDKDKSLSQKGSEQGCGDKLPPSDASLPFPPASDAPSPNAVGSSENTACGVNVNSFKTPLPPTPRMSSDVSVDEFVEKMYAMYPAECPQRNKSTGKSDKDRGRIKKLLKKYTMEQIELVFRYEIEQKYNKSYMSNFSTFLNNFPDPTQINFHIDNGSAGSNSTEPALPNGMTREKYEMYIRNGYEIDEYGRIYKDGIMLK